MLLNLFAQLTQDGTTQKTMLDMIKEGGWTMVPLFALSFLAVYIFIERTLAFQVASKDPKNFMDRVTKAVNEKDIKSAIAICESENSPISRMIQKGLRRLGNPLKTIEESIENVGKLEIDRLEKNLSLMATIAGAAPMIGFLGTVLGMIETFNVISLQGSANMKDMSGGISTAMITTAAGLIVGIFAYFSYNFLSAKIQKIVHRMEQSSLDFLDILQEPQK
jgi:biopolymer transport protein ExbB